MLKKVFQITIFLSTIIFSQEVTPKIFLSGNNVMAACSDQKYIWVATNGNGIARIEKKTEKIKIYNTSRRNIAQDFFFCIESNKKFVWAGSADGLFMLDKRRGKWSKRKFAKGGQLSNWVRSLKYDPKENLLWIGRFMYLTQYNIKKRRFYDYDLTYKNNIKSNTIKTIALDGDSLVWFGTEAGLHKYDKSMSIENPNSVTFYDNRLNYFEGMGDQVSITSLLVAENKLWIGLDEFITPENPEFNLGGLYNFDRRNEWARYDSHSGLVANGIFDIARSGNLIWVAQYQFGQNTKDQYGRGLAIINILTGEVKQLYDENLPQKINSLYFDNKILWISSNKGLYSINFENSLVNWN